MVPDENRNLVIFPLLVLLWQITGAVSSPKTIDDLFPPAPEFYETRFGKRPHPSILNRWKQEDVCSERSLFERIKICRKVLEYVKSTTLQLASEKTSVRPDERACEPITVIFQRLQTANENAQAYRCPLKYSLDSESSFYDVGELNPAIASFYLVNGDTPTAIFVLHDFVMDANEVAHQPAIQDEVGDVNLADATNTEALSDEPVDRKFHKILAAPGKKLYISYLFKVEAVQIGTSTDYNLVPVPDFRQMLVSQMGDKEQNKIPQ